MDRTFKEAKIRWLCRRGMLELDLSLQSFINHHLISLNDSELSVFEALLNVSDPLLYSWLILEERADKEFLSLVNFIKAHSSIR